MEHDESNANDGPKTEERDEMDDLDVDRQKAEDIKGGARGKRGPKERP